MSHGTLSCIFMYVNAIAVLCYSYEMVFITIFKIEHKLCTVSGPTPHPLQKIFECARPRRIILVVRI